MLRPDLPRIGTLALLILCGCGTTYECCMTEVEAAYAAGDYESARAATAPMLRIQPDGADYVGEGSSIAASTAALIDLEMAVLDLASGRPRSAADRSDFASRKFESMRVAYADPGFLDEVVKGAKALARPNLTYGTYQGSDWENVLCLGIAGIAELVQGHAQNAKGTTGPMQDLAAGWLAAWQSLYAATKDLQPENADPSAEKYVMTGLPYFLEGLCVEVTEDQPDLAKGAYQEAVKFEQRLEFAKSGRQPALEQGLQSHVQRAEAGGFAAPETARVWVLCMTDRLPRLVNAELKGSLLIQNIVKFVGAALGELAPEQLPEFTSILTAEPEPPRPPFESVQVAVDRGPAVAAPLVADLEPTLVASYERTVSRRITQAITLRLLKLVAAEVAKKSVTGALEDEESWVATTINYVIEGLRQLWTALEQPDTRSWRLLPRRVYCLRLELPVGAERETHRITIRAVAPGGGTVERAIDCDLRNDEDSFVFTILPDLTTPTAVYWSSERSSDGDLSWVVPPGQAERIKLADLPLDRDNPTQTASPDPSTQSSQ